MKYCRNCGKEIDENDNFCEYCGFNVSKKVNNEKEIA